MQWVKIAWKNIVFFHQRLWGPRVAFNAGETHILALNLFLKGVSISTQLKRAIAVWCLCIAQHSRAPTPVRYCNTNREQWQRQSSWAFALVAPLTTAFNRSYLFLWSKEGKLGFPHRWAGWRASHWPLTSLLPPAGKRAFGKLPFPSTRNEVILAMSKYKIPAYGHQP